MTNEQRLGLFCLAFLAVGGMAVGATEPEVERDYHPAVNQNQSKRQYWTSENHLGNGVDYKLRFEVGDNTEYDLRQNPVPVTLVGKLYVGEESTPITLSHSETIRMPAVEDESAVQLKWKKKLSGGGTLTGGGYTVTFAFYPGDKLKLTGGRKDDVLIFRVTPPDSEIRKELNRIMAEFEAGKLPAKDAKAQLLKWALMCEDTPPGDVTEELP